MPIMKVGDIKLYYEIHGKGEPIIFSHGWLDDCSVWKPQVEMLASDHTVITYDIRGHGRSDKPKGNYSFKTLINDLSAIIEVLKLEKVALAGFSLGGALSLEYALQNPEKVSKLILIGTAARMPRQSYFLLFPLNFMSYKTLIRLLYSKARFNKPTRQMIDAFISTANQVPKKAAYDILNELIKNYDIRNRCSEIKVPILLVRGEKDPYMSEPVQYLHEHLPDSQLQIVPACGHEVMVEKPEVFNQILQDYLRL